MEPIYTHSVGRVVFLGTPSLSQRAPISFTTTICLHVISALTGHICVKSDSGDFY